MSVLAKFLDFLLYGNFWIAAAAMALAFQSHLLLAGVPAFTPLTGFIGCGTLLLYTVHRLISAGRAGPFRTSGRFRVVTVLRPVLIGIAVVATPAAAWFFWHLDFRLQLLLLPAGLLSLGYTVPLFHQRRLRDVNHLKTFLVAATWAWITVAVVAAERHMATFLPAILMMLERFFFIFALTLPFDLRDREVDAYLQVRTIPGRLGPRRTTALAAVSLTAMLLFAGLNYRGDAYSGSVMAAMIISALSTFLLIAFAGRFRHDYYFSGLIDGAMILQFLLVWAVG